MDPLQIPLGFFFIYMTAQCLGLAWETFGFWPTNLVIVAVAYALRALCGRSA